MKKFTNRNYPYATPDDTFDAKGLQLNMIVDEINDLFTGVPVEIDAAGSDSIQLSRSDEMDDAVLEYKCTFPDKVIGGNTDQVGTLRINNSMEHSTIPSLNHTRESVNFGTGSEEGVTMDVTHDGKFINLDLVNTSGYALKFTYTIKIMKYVAD